MQISSIEAGTGFLAILAVLYSLVITLLWLSIGWRAMRAHERIAKVLERRADGG